MLNSKFTKNRHLGYVVSFHFFFLIIPFFTVVASVLVQSQYQKKPHISTQMY